MFRGGAFDGAAVLQLVGGKGDGDPLVAVHGEKAQLGKAPEGAPHILIVQTQGLGDFREAQSLFKADKLQDSLLGAALFLPLPA